MVDPPVVLHVPIMSHNPLQVGSEVGRRGRGLGMNVIAYDPYASAEKAAAMGVHMVSFEDALRYVIECFPGG